MTLASLSFPSFSDSPSTVPSQAGSSVHGGGGVEDEEQGHAGTGGGPNGGTEEVSGKTHLVLVTAKHCRGYIVRSSGTKICLEEECDTPAHHGEKVNVGEGGLVMMKVPKKNQAFVDAQLEPARLGGDVSIGDLESMWANADVLRAWIRDRNNEEDAPVDLLSQFDSTTATPARRGGGEPVVTHPSVRRMSEGSKARATAEFERAAKAVRTPAKLERTFQDSRLQGIFADREGTFHSLGTLEEVISRETGRANISLDDPQAREAVLRKLLAEVDSVGAATIEVGNAHRELNTKVHAAVDVLDERFLRTQRSINLLGGSLGEPSPLFAGNTLWQALQEVHAQALREEQLNEVLAHRERNLQGLVVEGCTRARNEAIQEVKGLEERVKAFLQNVGVQFEQMVSALKRLQNEGLKREQPIAAAGFSPAFATANAEQGRKLATKDEVISLEERLLNLEARGLSVGAPSQNDLTTIRREVESLVKAQGERLKTLEVKLVGDKVFRADGGSMYSSREDVLALVERNPDEKNISGFFDVVTIFIVMDRPALTGTEHANRSHVSARAGRGAGDSEAMASLTHERPPILFGSTADVSCTKLVAHTRGFGVRMKDYSEYDENMYGMRYRMQTMITDLETAQMTGLDESVEWNRVKSRMLRVAVGHANQLLAFITNMYRALTTTCKYSPGPAWNLVGRIVGTIFLTLKSIRARAVALEEISSPASRATFIWTMMQSTMMMQEIIERGFQSHPVVMKEIMEFQLENRVDASQLESLQGEIKTLKTQFKEVQAALAKTDKASSQVMDKMNKLSQELGNLRTEVNKLKK